MNRSNLSFFTLHTGQVSGGSSLAHRYPHTLQRHTGSESDNAAPAAFGFAFALPFLAVGFTACLRFFEAARLAFAFFFAYAFMCLAAFTFVFLSVCLIVCLGFF